MVTNTYSVLDTIAGAADASLNNSKLSITGAPPMDFRKIESFSYTAYAAGTAGVWTITPTASAATFNLVITQYVKTLGKVVTIPLMFTATSTSTATNICDAWRAQLTASTSMGYSFTPSGTATLILTATNGNNFINVVATGTGTTGVVNGTPGVARVGAGADVVLQYPLATSSNNYGQYEFVYSYLDLSSESGENALQTKKHVILANAGSANFAAFNTQVTTLLQAVATAAASIEGIALV